MHLIPKEAVVGERGCEYNEGGKILSAGGRSHRYEVCGQSFKQKSEVTEHEKIESIKKTYDVRNVKKTFNGAQT